MSKKDKKNKKKHSNDGDKKKNHIEVATTWNAQQNISTVPSDQQIGVNKKIYEKELAHLQVELIKLQEWVRYRKLKVVVIFEGRDAAGKGGVIKRITESLNPRICRVAALPAPTEREKTQWYFQRYVSHLPAGGEIVLFDPGSPRPAEIWRSRRART